MGINSEEITEILGGGRDGSVGEISIQTNVGS